MEIPLVIPTPHELPDSPIPIISISRAGVISKVNPQAIRDFGGIEQDLVGHSVEDLLSDKKTAHSVSVR